MHTRYFTFLLFLLLCKTAAMIWVIWQAGIGLGPDEAQYWTWSQLLDWGYYSKPPGIAWEIWLGTHLFGNTEWGVRCLSVGLGIAIPLGVYQISRNCQLSALACFWAGVAMAFSPIGMLASLLAITDGGMIFFWTLSCAYLAKVIQSEKLPNYILLGFLIMCGALFKWPIYSLWLLVLGSWLVFPRLRSCKILVGFCVSLMALLPSLYWNSTHEWSTFRHVLATLKGGNGQTSTQAFFAGNFFEFLGAQAALVSPILFVLLLIALWGVFKERRHTSPGVVFCAGLTVAILGIASLVALKMKLQGNWAIFAYPSAFVVLGWYVATRTQKWMIAGIILSVGLCGIIFTIPTIQAKGILKEMPIPYKWNPFRHNVGWQHLEKELTLLGYDPAHDFLFADKYQTVSILSFYGPEQKRAYFLNLHGIRKNQFSFWPSMVAEQVGKRGYFVVVENIPQIDQATPLIEAYTQELKPYFGTVHFIKVVPLFWAYGKVVKGALIFECDHYNGLEPIEKGLY